MAGGPAPNSAAFQIGFHLVVGILMALFYAFVLEPLLPRGVWLEGWIYAVAVWILNAAVVVPATGEGFAGSAHLSLAVLPAPGSAVRSATAHARRECPPQTDEPFCPGFLRWLHILVLARNCESFSFELRWLQSPRRSERRNVQTDSHETDREMLVCVERAGMHLSVR